MRRLAIVILASSVACGDFGATSSTSREVIGGDPTVAGAYAATGALMLRGNGGGAPDRYVGCTGTLIAPTVVLTAAHCVHPGLTQGQTPGFTLELDGMSAPEASIVPGQSALAHPEFDPFGGAPPPSLAQEYDIGLLFLSAPVTQVVPEAIVRPEDAAAMTAGAEVGIVGYGFTVEGSLDHYGTKHDAMTHIADVGTNELQIANPGEPQNCQGDSGGPALLEAGGARKVISVVSRGTTPNASDCSKGGIHSRVDVHLGWIHEHTELPCGSGLSADCADAPDAGAGVGPDAGPGSAGEDAGGGGAGATGDEHECGGCAAAGGGDAAAPAALLLLALAWRRRRPR